MKRGLLPSALTGMEVITGFKMRRIRVQDFELAMSQRGLRRPDCYNALAAFTRRGWVAVEGSILVLTDDGWLAATKGIGVKATERKPSRRSGNRRMPAGLF